MEQIRLTSTADTAMAMAVIGDRPVGRDGVGHRRCEEGHGAEAKHEFAELHGVHAELMKFS